MAAKKVTWNLTSSRIKDTLEKDEEGKYEHLEDYEEEGLKFEGTFNFGDNLEEMTEIFTEKVVFAHAKTSIGLWAAGKVRDWLQAGKTVDEVQELLNTTKPGVSLRKPKKTMQERWLEEAAEKSEEEREVELQAMEAKIAELRAAL